MRQEYAGGGCDPIGLDSVEIESAEQALEVAGAVVGSRKNLSALATRHRQGAR